MNSSVKALLSIRYLTNRLVLLLKYLNMIQSKIFKLKRAFRKLFKAQPIISVDDMTLDELIHTKLFRKNISAILKEILKSAAYSSSRGRRINPNLKYLMNNGYMSSPNKFIDEYRLVLMKVSILPTTYRTSVGAIGDRAVSLTVEQMKKAEGK